MRRLVLATRNEGKRLELVELLAGEPVEILSLRDFPDIGQIAENGETFEANARIKAHAVARATGAWALADDSGLEVAALDGRPGVYSARFAGAAAADAANNRLLLEKLAGVEDKRRTARFRCAIALVDPERGREEVRQGTAEGRIIREPRGSSGFGYDPLFFSPEAGKTFAELTRSEKSAISHRARALQAILPVLRTWLQGD